VGLAATVAALVIVLALRWPSDVAWPTGRDAFCYWFPDGADPYARADWTQQVAYVYSPAFLQVLAPLRALPWAAPAAWTAILLLAACHSPGRACWPRRSLPPRAPRGNAHLLPAAAIVAGFRWPAAWAFVLLTKVTPGIGLLWFALRREWRSLGIAIGATATIAAVSWVVAPAAWADWLEVLAARAAKKDGTWAALPVPLWLRLPLAVALVAWGARTERRWAVPVASMVALPALWFGGASMLLAVVALARDRERWRAERADATWRLSSRLS
jgi:hypothetical protein